MKTIFSDTNVDELPTGTYRLLSRYVLFTGGRGILQHDFKSNSVFIVVMRSFGSSIVIALRGTGDVRPQLHRPLDDWYTLEVANEKKL